MRFEDFMSMITALRGLSGKCDIVFNAKEEWIDETTIGSQNEDGIRLSKSRWIKAIAKFTNHEFRGPQKFSTKLSNLVNLMPQLLPPSHFLSQIDSSRDAQEFLHAHKATIEKVFRYD
eukprot:UN16035